VGVGGARMGVWPDVSWLKGGGDAGVNACIWVSVGLGGVKVSVWIGVKDGRVLDDIHLCGCRCRLSVGVRVFVCVC
jgi:hypothetical protein